MKAIEGWPDYFVTEYGSIFCQRPCRRHGNSLRRVKPFDGGNGYMYVNMTTPTRRKKEHVARLVCKAFIPNPENKRTVNHKNGDKTDNRVSNLEWATHQENHQHAFRELGRKVTPHPQPKGGNSPHAKPIKGYINDSWRTFPSPPDAAEFAGIDKRLIHRACKRKGSAKGIQWRFVKND